MDFYDKVMSGFISYENHCLYDTVVKGLPEFFKWYDIKFQPQDTILTLDYPVLKDLSKYTGIDKIYEFLICVDLEQKFLNLFPEIYVINLLSKYNKNYKGMTENLCEIVFTAVIGHVLIKKPFSQLYFEEMDYRQIRKVLLQEREEDINGQLRTGMKTLLGEFYEKSDELSEYLGNSVGSIMVRLKNAAENEVLFQLL